MAGLKFSQVNEVKSLIKETAIKNIKAKAQTARNDIQKIKNINDMYNKISKIITDFDKAATNILNTADALAKRVDETTGHVQSICSTVIT